MRLGAGVAAVLLLASLAACGQESGPRAGDGETATPEARPPGGPEPAGPPPLTLHRPEGDVDLEAYTWCYHDEGGVGGCADGPRPEHPPQTDAEGPLTFSFPLDGWSFTADFRVPGRPDSCDRYLRADAVPQPAREDGCPDDGALAFSGDAAPGEALDLPGLGEPPYSYEVHLTMDGRSYTGTGQWPDDLTPPGSSSLALEWSPPLPAWDGS